MSLTSFVMILGPDSVLPSFFDVVFVSSWSFVSFPIISFTFLCTLIHQICFVWYFSFSIFCCWCSCMLRGCSFISFVVSWAATPYPWFVFRSIILDIFVVDIHCCFSKCLYLFFCIINFFTRFLRVSLFAVYRKTSRRRKLASLNKIT